MPYRKYERVEKEKSKPMGKVLEELYDEHRDSNLVARDLGVTKKTLVEWRQRAGCELVVEVRIRCPDTASAR